MASLVTTTVAGTASITATTNDGAAAALNATQAGTGRGFQVARTVASATRAMADFIQLHASGGTSPAVHIQQTTTASDALRITSDGSTSKFAVTGTGALTTAGTVTINQDTNNYALSIDSESASYAAISIQGAKYGMYVLQDLGGGYGAYFHRNLNEAGANALVTINSDHTASTQPSLWVNQDGAGYGISLTQIGANTALNIVQHSTAAGIAIDQNGNGTALYINSESTTHNTIATYGKYGMYSVQDLSGGYGLYIYRNLNEAGSSALAHFIDDHTAGTQTTVYIKHDGSSGYALDCVGAGRFSGTATFDGNVFANGNNFYYGTKVITSSYVSVFDVNNANGLSTDFSFSVKGSANGVVIPVRVDVLTNHYQDITIKTQSGAYTTLTIKVTTSNDEDCTVWMKQAGANNVTCYIYVQTTAGGTVDWTPSEYSGSTLEHVCGFGFAFSTYNGGSASTSRLAGGGELILAGGLTATTGAFSGAVTTAALAATTGSFGGHVTPSSSVSFNLGSSGLRWLNIYGHTANFSAGLTVSGAVYNSSGTVSAPSISFTGDTDTGIWRPGSNQLWFVTTGVNRIKIDGSGNTEITGALTGTSATFSGTLTAATSLDEEFRAAGRKRIEISRTVGTTSGNTVAIGKFSNDGTGLNARIYFKAHNNSVIDVITYEFNMVGYIGTATDWLELPVQNGVSYLGRNKYAIDVYRPNIGSTSDSLYLRVRNIDGTAGGGSCQMVIEYDDDVSLTALTAASTTATTFNASTAPAGGAVTTGLYGNVEYQFPVTNAVGWGSGSGKGLYIKNGGSVGIGTDAPAYFLDVNGTANIVGALTGTTAAFSGNITGGGTAIFTGDMTIADDFYFKATNAWIIAGSVAGGALTGGTLRIQNFGELEVDGHLDVNGSGTSTFAGAISCDDITCEDVSPRDILSARNITASTATFSGALTGTSATFSGLFKYTNSAASNGTGDLKIIPTASSNTGVGFASQIIGVNIADALSSNLPKQDSTWGGVTGSSAIALNADDNTYGQFMVLTAPQDSSANTELTPRFWITGAGAAQFSGALTGTTATFSGALTSAGLTMSSSTQYLRWPNQSVQASSRSWGFIGEQGLLGSLHLYRSDASDSTLDTEVLRFTNDSSATFYGALTGTTATFSGAVTASLGLNIANNQRLSIGTAGSNTGYIRFYNDNSTAYYLDWESTAARAYRYHGADSGGAYVTTFSQAGSGGHNVTVAGNINLAALPSTTVNAAVPILFRPTEGTLSGDTALTWNPAADSLDVNGTVITQNHIRSTHAYGNGELKLGSANGGVVLELTAAGNATFSGALTGSSTITSSTGTSSAGNFFGTGNGSNFVASTHNATGIFGHFRGERAGTTKYYLGLDASDNFAVLDSSANRALTIDTAGGTKAATFFGDVKAAQFYTGYDWTTRSGGLNIGSQGITTGAVTFYDGVLASSASIYRDSSSVFFVGARGGTSTTGIAIDTNGNVGIGDSTPNYKLDVNGTGRFTGTLTAAGATFNGVVLPSADGAYNLGDNTTRWATIFADTFYGNGANITSLNASNISSGTVAAARLGSGSSITSKFLRGDNTWQTVSSGGSGTVTSVATTGAITGGTITTSGTIAHSTSAGYKHVPSGGSSGQFLKYSSSGTAVWAGGVLNTDFYVHVGMRTTAASGTDGGTLTSNTWVTRDLNHTYTNNGGFATVSTTNNTVTLGYGTYYVRFWATGYGVQEHQAQFYNSTDSYVYLNGSNQRPSSAIENSNSIGSGIVSFGGPGTKAFLIRHIVDYTRATYGGGRHLDYDDITSGNFSYNTYWGLEIWKVG